MTQHHLTEERNERLLAAMQQALRGRDKGAQLQELWPAWSAATGLSRNSLAVLLHGSYNSRTAWIAYKTVGQEAGRRAPGPTPPKRRATTRQADAPPRGTGKPTALTADVILQMRKAAAQGATAKDLAVRFETKPEVVNHILRGIYWTRAMKDALAQENLASEVH